MLVMTVQATPVPDAPTFPKPKPRWLGLRRRGARRRRWSWRCRRRRCRTRPSCAAWPRAPPRRCAVQVRRLPAGHVTWQAARGAACAGLDVGSPCRAAACLYVRLHYMDVAGGHCACAAQHSALAVERSMRSGLALLQFSCTAMRPTLLLVVHTGVLQGGVWEVARALTQLGRRRCACG